MQLALGHHVNRVLPKCKLHIERYTLCGLHVCNVISINECCQWHSIRPAIEECIVQFQCEMLGVEQSVAISDVRVCVCVCVCVCLCVCVLQVQAEGTKVIRAGTSCQLYYSTMSCYNCHLHTRDRLSWHVIDSLSHYWFNIHTSCYLLYTHFITHINCVHNSWSFYHTYCMDSQLLVLQRLRYFAKCHNTNCDMSGNVRLCCTLLCIVWKLTCMHS